MNKRGEPFKIGGRLFREITVRTVERDHYVMGRAHRAGILNLTLKDGEKNDEFCMRILLELMASGETCALIGGLIIPEGIDDRAWTAKVAEETAYFVSRLGGEDEKAVNNILVNLILDFSARGLISFWRIEDSTGESPQETAATAQPH